VIGLNISIPAGQFSGTHIAGAGLDYSPAKLNKRLFHSKKLFLDYNAAMEYYLGAHGHFNGYPVHYRDYLLTILYGGVLYSFSTATDAQFMIGPGLGLHNHYFSFTPSLKGQLDHYFKSGKGVGVQLNVYKESGARPITSIGIRGTWIF
jgi:hypothetical protein